MRKLKVSDAGKASKILKLMELRVESDGSLESLEALGASLFLVAMENYHKAEVQIAELMASLIEEGMTAKKFLNLDLEEAAPYFEKLKEDTGLKSFFKLVGKLS